MNASHQQSMQGEEQVEIEGPNLQFITPAVTKSSGKTSVFPWSIVDEFAARSLFNGKGEQVQ
jgi:hypothetical protein